MSRAPVKDFIDALEELTRAGHVLVGAIHDPESTTVEGLGRLRCPFCESVVVAAVLAGFHSESRELAGGAFLIVGCEHRDLIEDIRAAVEFDIANGSPLPERP